MTTEALKKPFSKAFVLNTTMRHMQRSIDISLGKTFERLQDAQNQDAPVMEIMETLSVLHMMRNMNNEFVKQNPSLFKS